ncbi:MAG: hypothetical protein K2N03_01430 [Muribaculaceae bacterium]|nr:hypothetical protein [Muribaculaceae bacterium]
MRLPDVATPFSSRNKSPLQYLCRGRFLFDSLPCPEQQIETLFREGIANGLKSLLIFDPLNDYDNLREPVTIGRRLGLEIIIGEALTYNPGNEHKNPSKPRESKHFLAGLLKGHREPVAPESVYSVDFFVDKGLELSALGNDRLWILVPEDDPFHSFSSSDISSIADTLRRETTMVVDICFLPSGVADYKDSAEELRPILNKLRRDSGLAPMFPPISEILTNQAKLIKKDREMGNEDYTSLDSRYVALIKGEFGSSTVLIDPLFRRRITGALVEKPL